MTPTIVLTRPEAQSRQIAAELGAEVRVVISPIMEIVSTAATPDLSSYRGVILTSANALLFAPALSGQPTYCVGQRTADAARAAGAEIAIVAQTADDLVARVEGPGPLLHLRGKHARSAVATRLSSAGIETHEAVIYDQVARPLTDEAKGLIEGRGQVVLPLYSPRSARLAGAGVGRVGPRVRAIALSAAVAEAWAEATGIPAEMCAAPTGVEMRARIDAALRG